MKPRFIVLEGLDGSGKSTQLSLLSHKMTKQGLLHIATRQPSDGPAGTLVREALYTNAMENETLALLFAADRYQHVKKTVAPALNQGKHVLCDRYYYSNLVYQAGDAEALTRLMAYNQVVMEENRPDIVLFLDVAPEECMRRLQSREDASSIYENLARLKEDRNRFANVFNKLGGNVIIVDANSTDKNIVSNQLWQHIERIITQANA